MSYKDNDCMQKHQFLERIISLIAFSSLFKIKKESKFEHWNHFYGIIAFVKSLFIVVVLHCYYPSLNNTKILLFIQKNNCIGYLGGYNNQTLFIFTYLSSR